MSKLESQIRATLLSGMSIPTELSQLFTWIENNKLFIDNDEGRIGLLYPEDKRYENCTTDERNGGTEISFAAEGNINLHYWFGHDRPEVLNRLCVFAKTGGEGSMAAFWLDDQGRQKIVHLGSGSGSTMVCVLAENALDFLRLIAIGYDEICWNDNFNETPEETFNDNYMVVKPNRDYQQWLTQTFNTTIPKRANEIVKHPAEMGDVDSPDEFTRWVEANV